MVRAHGYQVVVPGIDGSFHSFACAQSAYARLLDEQRTVETVGRAAASAAENDSAARGPTAA
jgi:hypothetical protein